MDHHEAWGNARRAALDQVESLARRDGGRPGGGIPLIVDGISSATHQLLAPAWALVGRGPHPWRTLAWRKARERAVRDAWNPHASGWFAAFRAGLHTEATQVADLKDLRRDLDAVLPGFATQVRAMARALQVRHTVRTWLESLAWTALAAAPADRPNLGCCGKGRPFVDQIWGREPAGVIHVDLRLSSPYLAFEVHRLRLAGARAVMTVLPPQTSLEALGAPVFAAGVIPGGEGLLEVGSWFYRSQRAVWHRAIGSAAAWFSAWSGARDAPHAAAAEALMRQVRERTSVGHLTSYSRDCCEDRMTFRCPNNQPPRARTRLASSRGAVGSFTRTRSPGWIASSWA